MAVRRMFERPRQETAEVVAVCDQTQDLRCQYGTAREAVTSHGVISDKIRRFRSTPRVRSLAPVGRIERRILPIRGQNVMLDEGLARLYGVETRVLVQAVKRNLKRFPRDFMFQVSDEENRALRSRNVTLKPGRGGRRYLPYAFTEQGVAMLSSVLHSERAIHVNIEIMRAFVRLRRMVESVAELRRKVDALEQRYDAQFREVFDAIRALMEPPAPLPPPPKRRIGFRSEDQS
jgi:hypothetical protein